LVAEEGVKPSLTAEAIRVMSPPQHQSWDRSAIINW